MIFGGCYSGVEDAGGGSSVGDRWGKTCYYSYSSDRSASYTTESSDKAETAKTDKGFTLTMKADSVSQDPDQLAHIFNEMRIQAGISAEHYIAQSCWDADDIADTCRQTCEERGLSWNEEVVVCDGCKVLDDGSLDCGGEIPPALQEALSQPWFGEEPWFFTNEEAQLHLVMMPPRLTENWQGELVWIAEVEVTGFCLCACT